MNDEQKLYFIYGTLYITAYNLKNDTEYYKSFTVKEIIKELIEEIGL